MPKLLWAIGIVFSLAIAWRITLHLLYWPDTEFLFCSGMSRAEVVEKFGAPSFAGENQLVYYRTLNVVLIDLNDHGTVKTVEVRQQD